MKSLLGHSPSPSALPGAVLRDERQSGWSSYVGGDAVPAEGSDQTVPHAPLMLGEEHAPQLGKASWRIVEHPQDRLAIGDRESNENLLGVQRDKERIARVLEACRVQEPSQGGDVLFADGNTGEPHATDATLRSGASNRASLARISPVFKVATGRESGFSRSEIRAAQIRSHASGGPNGRSLTSTHRRWRSGRKGGGRAGRGRNTGQEPPTRRERGTLADCERAHKLNAPRSHLGSSGKRSLPPSSSQCGPDRHRVAPLP